jgi:hypothetical protein
LEALVKNDGYRSKSEYVTNFVDGDYDAMIEYNKEKEKNEQE